LKSTKKLTGKLSVRTDDDVLSVGLKTPMIKDFEGDALKEQSNFQVMI